MWKNSVFNWQFGETAGDNKLANHWPEGTGESGRGELRKAMKS